MRPFAFFLLASLPSAALTGEPATTRPNIVMIVADDHGTDALGAYGNPIIKTPNLDGLAREGVRFTHAFCTAASCSPSRSVILTGQQTHRNGMYGLQHQEPGSFVLEGWSVKSGEAAATHRGERAR